MKPEYKEGREARENFEEGMKVLFRVPKSAVTRKGGRHSQKLFSVRKTKRTDKD
jgi:hypothetical protein